MTTATITPIMAMRPGVEDISEELMLIHYAFLARGFSWNHPKVTDWLARYHAKYPPKFTGEVSPAAIKALYRALLPITPTEVLTAIALIQAKRSTQLKPPEESV